MARRRLTPEDRRAEIISTATEAIAADGYSSLSLREMARRSGMSTPGLIRYFPTMEDLLVAVLEERDATEIPSIDVDRTSVFTAIDSILAHYDARHERTRAFDVLEGEALSPGHPAHSYFAERNRSAIDGLRPLIEKEFADADGVAEILELLLDGARMRALRDPHAKVSQVWPTIRRVLGTLPRTPA